MASIIGPAASTHPAHETLRKQAVELEGVFLNTLMKEMFASVKTDAADFGGGFAEETWRGMQAEQFANAMAEAGGIGLAEALLPDLPDLLALQEGAPSNPVPPLHGAYR